MSHRKHCIKMFRIPVIGDLRAPDLAFQAFMGARAPGRRSILASCGAGRRVASQAQVKQAILSERQLQGCTARSQYIS